MTKKCITAMFSILTLSVVCATFAEHPESYVGAWELESCHVKGPGIDMPIPDMDMSITLNADGSYQLTSPDGEDESGTWDVADGKLKATRDSGEAQEGKSEIKDGKLIWIWEEEGGVEMRFVLKKKA